MRFIDRDEELRFLKAYLETEPNAITFVYGPKSSGKSVLMKKVIEDLLKGGGFTAFYFDLRGRLISGYDGIVDMLFADEGVSETREVEKGLEFGIFSYFRVKKTVREEIRNRKVDPFYLMEEALRKAEGRKLIVFDELQRLKNVYLNSPVNQKSFIEELFNFFVRLTKVEHLSHVFVLSSDTFFIEEIYANSSLSESSEYYLVDDPPEEIVKAYLLEEGFSTEEIECVLNGIGPLLWAVNQIVVKKRAGVSVEESVSSLIDDAYSKILTFLSGLEVRGSIRDEYIRLLKKLLEGPAKVIPFDGNMRKYKELADREIVFYDPLKGEVRIRSRAKLHAIRKLLKEMRIDET